MSTDQSYTTNLYQNSNEENDKVRFLKEQTECPLCQGKLNIFTECIDAFRVKEEARCTQCMALLREQSHDLH